VNWRLVAPFALLGPAMGALMVMGVFPKGADRFAWFAIVVVSALVVARRERERALFHGAVLGFWNGASSTMVQALYVEKLVANNPWIAERFAHQPPGFDLEFFVFMLVPFIGVAGGGLTGLVAMAAARIFAARDAGPGAGGETSP